MIYRLCPLTQSRHAQIIHAAFSLTGLFDEKQRHIVNLLVLELNKIGIKVAACCFDGDRKSVQFFVSPQFAEIYPRLTRQKKLLTVGYVMKAYQQMPAIPDPLHLLKRMRSQIVFNNCVIDHSASELFASRVINARNIEAVLALGSKRVYSQNKSLKMDDKIAMTLLSPSNMIAFWEAEYYEMVFVLVLALPLFFPYVDSF